MKAISQAISGAQEGPASCGLHTPVPERTGYCNTQPPPPIPTETMGNAPSAHSDEDGTRPEAPAAAPKSQAAVVAVEVPNP